MIRLVFIRSGSRGNATLVQSESSLILIDMGVTLKNLKAGCALLNKTTNDLDGAFFTHNHCDHIKNSHMIPRFCSVFASKSTLDYATEELIPGVGVDIKDLVVIPFSVSHDAPDPMNFLVLCGEEKYVHITDTGYVDESLLPLIQDADYYLMESNHDVDMEIRSGRPKYLIKRVLGDEGHLSNVDSAEILCKCVGPHTKGIYLGHLSDDCNTHEVALETHRKIYSANKVDISDIELVCTSQEEIVVGGDKL